MAARRRLSHGVLVGETLHYAGQLGRDPTSGQLQSSSAARQAERALANLAAICQAR